MAELSAHKHFVVVTERVAVVPWSPWFFVKVKLLL